MLEFIRVAEPGSLRCNGRAAIHLAWEREGAGQRGKPPGPVVGAMVHAEVRLSLADAEVTSLYLDRH